MIETEVTEVLTTLRNKECIREALQRSQFLIPGPHERISLGFYAKVLRGQAWLPSKSEVCFALCARPPPKSKILEEIRGKLTEIVKR